MRCADKVAARHSDRSIILVDYQNQSKGGNDFLRLLQLSGDSTIIRVSDYSLTLDQISEVKGASLELDVPPAPRSLG